MSTVHRMKNTDQELKCVQCGSGNTNIVKEGPDPRLKCNSCNFMFDASQSKAAEDAGAIPEEGSAQISTPDQSEAASNPREPVDRAKAASDHNDFVSFDQFKDKHAQIGTEKITIPRNPEFVILSKDRKETRFVTKKNLKKTILKFESQEKNYDLFQLTAKQAAVKVDFNE